MLESSEKIDSKSLAQLQEHLIESALPFKVDLVDASKIGLAFKESLQSEMQIFIAWEPNGISANSL